MSQEQRNINSTWRVGWTDCSIPAKPRQTLYRGKSTTSSSSCLPGPNLRNIHDWCGPTAICAPPD
eukprot:8083681-Prorocentrum_lima.AAC.1